MNASSKLKKLGIEQTLNYAYKDPDKNLPLLMDWADKFSNGLFPGSRKAIRSAISDPSDPYYRFVRHIFQDVDPKVAKAGAHSTDLQSPESVEHLCSKCDRYARDWLPEAEKLWNKEKADAV